MSRAWKRGRFDASLAFASGRRRPYISGSMQTQSPDLWHGTTILTVRKDGSVVIGGDRHVAIGR
jgi:hypothetical protein